jgi:hypothetical protein
MGSSSQSIWARLVRALLVALAAGVSILNGLPSSPVFDSVFFLMRPFIPRFLLFHPLFVFYFTTVFISVTTLLVAGVPAALYERVLGRQESSVASLAIWCASALLLSQFGLMAFIGWR